MQHYKHFIIVLLYSVDIYVVMLLLPYLSNGAKFHVNFYLCDVNLDGIVPYILQIPSYPVYSTLVIYSLISIQNCLKCIYC